jgi:hypothetical protein
VASCGDENGGGLFGVEGRWSGLGESSPGLPVWTMLILLGAVQSREMRGGELYAWVRVEWDRMRFERVEDVLVEYVDK